MSNSTASLPNDPALLKAMIAALQAENEKMSASLRAHDLLVQALRERIAKLQKQAFGANSEKIEREIEQLELALEDLQVAMAEGDDSPHDESDMEKASPGGEADRKRPRRRPRVSESNCASSVSQARSWSMKSRSTMRRQASRRGRAPSRLQRIPFGGTGSRG